jgi:multidrug efflux system membrane fusion protein
MITRCKSATRKKKRMPGPLVPVLILAALLSGCTRAAPEVAPPEKLVVPVSHPEQREVTDYVEFTGRTDAVEAVDVRARVTGYLTQIYFREGSEVKKGDLLFEIDPRPYKAQLDNALSQVSLNEAQLKLASATYARDRVAGTAAVSAQQLDQDMAAVEEARARIKAAQASLEVYQLNLAFTKVTSPIAGMVSRYYLTTGNLVNQDQTLLTTVVSLDPIYTYFDMDEPTLLKIRRAISVGRVKRRQPGQMDSPQFVASSVSFGAFLPGTGPLALASVFRTGLGEEIPIYMGLQGEDDYPHKGTLNFVNNQVNPSTGSISVRGVFANPKLKGGVRLLSPGMFARIQLPIGPPHPALLVIDRAIGSDQGLKFVYVLDKDHKVQQRRVTTGALQPDGLRVIEPSDNPEEGLQPDDWIVVGAILQVRPRMVVQPEYLKTMPRLGTTVEEKGTR